MDTPRYTITRDATRATRVSRSWTLARVVQGKPYTVGTYWAHADAVAAMDRKAAWEPASARLERAAAEYARVVRSAASATRSEFTLAAPGGDA